MNNLEFDNYIKTELEAYTPTLGTPDWSRMESMIKADLQLAAQEDQYIKDKLEQINTHRAPNWLIMSQLIDDDTKAIAQEDLIVKQKLTHIPTSAQPNWQKMEAMIHQAVSADQVFDKQVAEKIDTAFYKKSDWPTFEEKVFAQKIRRRQIIIARALELSVFFLLIWTTINYGPEVKEELQSKHNQIFTHSDNTTPNIDNTQAFALAQQHDQAISQLTHAKQNISHNTNSANVLASQTTKPTYNSRISKPSNGKTVQHKNTSTFANNTQAIVPSELFAITKTNNNSENKPTTITTTPLTQAETTSHGKPNNADELTPQIIISPTNETTQTSIEDLIHSQTLNKETNASEQAIADLPEVSIPVTPATPKHPHMSIGLLGGANILYTITPAEKVKQSNDLHQQFFNSSIGIPIDIAIGKFVLSTGLIYQKYNYENIREIIGGINNTYAKTAEINYHMISFPLCFKQVFNISPKLSAFYKVGPQLTLNMASEFTVHEEQISEQINTASNRPSSSFERNLQDTENGIIHSQSISKNSFFAGLLGGGLQYQIHPSISVFSEVQAAWMLSKKSFGPNENTLHNYSAHIGFLTPIR